MGNPLQPAYSCPDGRDVIPRWPFYASVAVLGCECIACFLAGFIQLGERGAMVGINSAEAAEQARFAIELGAIGALNLLASIAFLLRRTGWVGRLCSECRLGFSCWH
jgi:hypothetical protein